MALNLYDFSDKLNSSTVLREEFIGKYVKYITDNMDIADIISEWASMLENELLSDLREAGADTLVERVAYEYPELLEDEFGVDTSLVTNHSAIV